MNNEIRHRCFTVIVSPTPCQLLRVVSVGMDVNSKSKVSQNQKGENWYDGSSQDSSPTIIGGTHAAAFVAAFYQFTSRRLFTAPSVGVGVITNLKGGQKRRKYENENMFESSGSTRLLSHSNDPRWRLSLLSLARDENSRLTAAYHKDGSKEVSTMNLLQVKGCLPTSTKSAKDPLAVDFKNLLETVAKADNAELTTFEVSKGVVRISFSSDATADKAATQLRGQSEVEVTALNPIVEHLARAKKAQEKADKMKKRWKDRLKTAE